MIELFTYKLLSDYITENVPEITWLDLYNDQYDDEENDRPFTDTSCFIEFREAVDVTTALGAREDGILEVVLHLTFPRSDNYTTKKKNVDESLNLLTTTTKLKKALNTLDSSVYPQTSVYRNSMLIEATDAYFVGKSQLYSRQVTHNRNFQICKLTYRFEYSDLSSSTSKDYINDWDWELFLGTGEQVGSFGNDFATSYDVRNDINDIWVQNVTVSGTTLEVLAHSFKEGVPMELEYGMIDNGDQIPDYVSTNTFNVISGGSYWVYIRDQRGIAAAFPNNPIIID